MSWITDLLDKAEPPFVINDSKTPSGRAHVGALRGVMVHDSIYRSARDASPDTKYWFGCDDYDALDELPHGLEDFYRDYLGVPLCNVPAPPGAAGTDIADHYISEFFGLFPILGVEAQTYRMRDLYRSGQMDAAIDAVLRNSQKIREIYLRVSGSVKAENWHPLQVICPDCGRIGTTIVTDYANELVQYECSPTLTSWATGCGRSGWMDPFGGNSKLPWKIEWAARWTVLNVSIEGAGKDHTTRGGSRDVAGAVAREVLGITPPLNFPYEFFLVGGSKMSSSKGLGASAADISELLPPQVLRFLLVRTPPRRALNFTPDLESITRLFADYDRILADTELSTDNALTRDLFMLSRVPGARPESARVGKMLPWDTIVSLAQLPHIDITEQARSRFDPPLSGDEEAQLRRRIDSARYWLSNYSEPEDRVALVADDQTSAVLADLSNAQRAFLAEAAVLLEGSEWSPDAIQGVLFEAARLTPLPQGKAFEAVYRILLDRDSGPRAGNLLAFLDRAQMIDRFRGARYVRRELLLETARPGAAIVELLGTRKADIASLDVTPELTAGAVDGVGVADVVLHMNNGRAERVRALLVPDGSQIDEERFRDLFAEFVREVGDITGDAVDVAPAPS